MSVVFLALGSAFCVGLINVLMRKGLDSTSKTQAILVSLIVAASIFWTLSIALGKISLLFAPAAALFLLSGLFGPGIARTFNIVSLKRIGVSRTVPVSGTAPFFATVLAIFLLGEEFSLSIFLGIVLIIFGIFVLSRRRENGVRVFDKKDLLIPLGSAFFGGFSIVVTKKAISMLDDPIVGITIALTTALLVLLLFFVGAKRLKNVNLKKEEIAFPVLAGCAMAGGFFLNFTALQMGDVSIVAPVFSTFPLFGVFLSHFFLREQITGRTWLGAVIIVAGIARIQFL